MTQPRRLTHTDESGHARMVDVSAKDVTVRSAAAAGVVRTTAEVVGLIGGGGIPKGDALGVARLAGIMAAKRTPDLVPLIGQASHQLGVLARANALIVVTEQTVRMEEGEQVDVVSLP